MTKDRSPWPWRAELARTAARVLSADGETVAMVPAGGLHKSANAALIAAAPDLLAALMACRGQWIHSVNADACLRALARAGGGGGNSAAPLK